jgi:hypothetical protein
MSTPRADQMIQVSSGVSAERHQHRLLLLVAFSLLFAVFIITPAMATAPFGLYPLMSWGDAIDLLTPVVLLPTYGLLFRAVDGNRSGVSVLLFLALLGIWAEGQGMHLAANSIGHLLEDMHGSEAGQLTYAYDEVLSHYLWHAGVVGLAVLLVLRERAIASAPTLPGRVAIGLSGALHGLLLFIIFVEAQTVPLGLPALALLALGILVLGRTPLDRFPLRTFYLVAAGVGLLLLGSWGVYWQGFPEFSAVGLLH